MFYLNQLKIFVKKNLSKIWSLVENPDSKKGWKDWVIKNSVGSECRRSKKLKKE